MNRLGVAVIGGGWAGLAAAVHACDAGHRVCLFEMAAQCGGRARSDRLGSAALDNGQHILLGAYAHTLALMRHVGVDPDQVLLRSPLKLHFADGRTLALRRGAAAPAFVRAVLTCAAWTWPERAALLRHAAGWALRGFRCEPDLTVAGLCRGLPEAVRALVIDPLCMAALNTRPDEASAAVMLRVLRDGLFGGRGASDLLLPRRPLDDLLPGPAERWLRQAGAEVLLGRRVLALERQGDGWSVDGRPFERVVLCCSATEAARLARPWSAAWSDGTQAMSYEPIVTVYLQAPGARLPAPMTALVDDDRRPAQFVFDHGVLGGPAGRFAAVASAARPWTELGLDATAERTVAQLQADLPPGTWPQPPRVLEVRAEKRATFRCTPGLVRPSQQVAPGLLAAGDYVDGPYPATIEGAVRAGQAAAAALR